MLLPSLKKHAIRMTGLSHTFLTLHFLIFVHISPSITSLIFLAIIQKILGGQNHSFFERIIHFWMTPEILYSR